MTFTGTAGAANPAAKTASITNTGGGTLTYTASDDAAWLSETPTNGTAPQTLSISADLSGLAAGTYSGTITITAAGATGSPKTIPVTLTVAAAPPPNVGLVAAYGFEETSGAGVLDASGTGNSGTLTGATRITTGKNGRALSFTGTGNLVTVPDSASLDLVRMTLEAWVYPTSLGTAWRTVMLKERPGDLAYGLYANTHQTRPSGVIYTTREIESRGSAALPVNAWSHLATTYDGSTLRLYVNGTQVSSANAAGTLFASTSPLRLGGNSVWGEWFAGRLDDVRVYNRTLSPTEVQSDMNIGVPAG
jgi:Concanavalin A-like lectin/glucanases superfamily/Viral BACON domain